MTDYSGLIEHLKGVKGNALVENPDGPIFPDEVWQAALAAEAEGMPVVTSDSQKHKKREGFRVIRLVVGK